MLNSSKNGEEDLATGLEKLNWLSKYGPKADAAEEETGGAKASDRVMGAGVANTDGVGGGRGASGRVDQDDVEAAKIIEQVKAGDNSIAPKTAKDSNSK